MYFSILSLGGPIIQECCFSGTYLVKPYKIFIYERGGTDDLYNALPKREGDVEGLILNNLKPGDIFVDIGANIGYYTILASKLVGANGRVFAIEPVPQTVKILKINLLLNEANNVTLIEKAAWNITGKLRIKISKGWFGLASLFRNEGWEIEVDAITLDEVLPDEQLSEIKLIKIDVEGAGYEVLQGLARILQNTKIVILELSRKTESCLKLLQTLALKHIN
jgi:FkbM family methyltransferase